MKKHLTLIVASILFSMLAHGQLGYSPVIDSLVDLITEQSISDLELKLTGETSVVVNGVEETITSRYANAPTNPLAAEWIYEQLEALGYEVEYQYFGSKGENVIATRTGTVYPDQQYIICAHYDNMPPQNFAPGADDNASGVVGVLETARILKDIYPSYTLKFIAFDEEELGLIGSWAYADEASNNADDILGVLNMDMLAYDSNGDNMMSISVNSSSMPFADYFTSAMHIYHPEMSYNYISTTASDHYPFWANGYQAILVIEDWNDFHPYYHTVQDNFDNLNIPYFHNMAQTCAATFSSLALDYIMELDHDPLQPGSITSSRIAELVIQSNHPVATGENAPRLYYKVGTGDFEYLHAYEQHADTFRFLIPGQAIGSTVYYYFAAQDENGDLISTLPSGGLGINPPGTSNPEELFEYFVGDISVEEFCTTTAPKEIRDLQNIYDTIPVNHEGIVVDMNVRLAISHPAVGELDIYLIGPDGTEIELSTGNGGNGSNFINTVFDDDAETSITNGTPPYNGTFKPEEPLHTMAGLPLDGNWILRIYDAAPGNEGLLANWCMETEYFIDPVSVASVEPHDFSLFQNFPNPFHSRTTIGFELSTPGKVNMNVFDITGKKVMEITSKSYAAGTHQIDVNAGSLPAGRYFYRMITDQNVVVKSMTIIR